MLPVDMYTLWSTTKYLAGYLCICPVSSCCHFMPYFSLRSIHARSYVPDLLWFVFLAEQAMWIIIVKTQESVSKKHLLTSSECLWSPVTVNVAVGWDIPLFKDPLMVLDYASFWNHPDTFRIMLLRHSQQRPLLNCKVASMHVQPKLVARELLRWCFMHI